MAKEEKVESIEPQETPGKIREVVAASLRNVFVITQPPYQSSIMRCDSLQYSGFVATMHHVKVAKMANVLKGCRRQLCHDWFETCTATRDTAIRALADMTK